MTDEDTQTTDSTHLERNAYVREHGNYVHKRVECSNFLWKQKNQQPIHVNATAANLYGYHTCSTCGVESVYSPSDQRKLKSNMALVQAEMIGARGRLSAHGNRM